MQYLYQVNFDTLYQLMRLGLLDAKTYRAQADLILKKICLEDGMTPLRAWYVYHAVRVFGNQSVDPEIEKNVLVAP